MKIISDGITSEERELLYGEAKEKNHIYNEDKELKRNVTDKMKEIFKNKETIQNFNELNNKKNVEFTLIKEDECPKKMITEKEYQAFPQSSKNKNSVLLNSITSSILIIIIFLAFLIFNICTINIEKPLYVSIILIGTLLAVFVAMCLVIKSKMKEEQSKQISKDSKISKGNVIQFRDIPLKSSEIPGSIYAIDVAFYDEKKYVKRINCSKKVYDMLSLDSEVIIYNSRIYAYDKNNNIIC